MRRIATLGLVAVTGALCSLGVIPGTTTSAAALDWDPSWGWEEYWDLYVITTFHEGPGGSPSAFDKALKYVFGGDGVNFVTGEVCTPGSDPNCGQPQYGYAPSPTNATGLFTSATKAAGVTVKAGNSTAVFGGMVANFLGVSASTVLVDTEATDLEMVSGDEAGWTGGGNCYSLPGGAVCGESPSYNPETRVITVTLDAPAGNWNGNSPATAAPKVSAYVLGGGGGSVNTRLACLNDAGSIVSSSTSNLANYSTWTISGTVFTTVTKTYTCPLGTVNARVELPTTDPRAEWNYSDWVTAEVGLVGTVESSYTCRKADGSTHTTERSQSVSAGEGLAEFEIPSFTCAADELLTHALVEWVTDEGTQEVFEYEAPEWVQDLPAEWQVCGVSTTCELRLYKKVGAETQYCGQYAVGCPEWWEADWDGYECRYGSFVVDIGFCAIYRVVGKESPTTHIKVDTDGKVTTESPAGKPKEYFDETLPKPKPPTITTPETPLPVPPGGGDTSGDSSACWPSGWGIFNPLEWVYRPVTCALTWAFVPDPENVALELARGNAAVTEHGVLGVVPAALAVPGQVSEGFSGGCSGSLAVFEVDTWAGDLEASLPCSPASMGDVGTQYDGFRTLLGGVIVVGTAWGVFITVRAYFGGRDS